MRWGRWAVGLLVAASVGCASTGVVTFPEGAGGVVTPADADVVGPIRMVGRDLVDATGRTVIIHGTNSVDKQAPYLSPLEDGWLGPADFERFRGDGVNGVRLGVWAAALMPEPGVIDHEYLDRVIDVVDELEAHHLWVLLDFHQDVFTGMPAWATTPAAAALSDAIPPEIAGIGWAAAYASPRSLRQWGDWWANVPTTDGRGVRDAFGDGIAAVAERVRDEPNVIGIDLLNEPFAGDQFLTCVLSTCPGRYRQVSDAFTALTARVRAVAPELPVWWEPFNFGQPYPGIEAPPENVGYSFHAYCLGTDGGEPVAPDPVAVAFCTEVFAGYFGHASSIGAAWDRPALLGEFGASSSPLNATITARLADEHLTSWFHWHSPPVWPEVVQTQLVRTYAQATAGRPTLQRFDPATGSFEFRYAPDHTITAPTSIVVPGEQYPDGYVVSVVGGTTTSPADSGRLTIDAAPSVDEVIVRVERATPE